MTQNNERFIKFQRLSRTDNNAWRPRPTSHGVRMLTACRGRRSTNWTRTTSSSARAHVRTFGMWTAIQHVGPNHLGLCSNAGGNIWMWTEGLQLNPGFGVTDVGLDVVWRGTLVAPCSNRQQTTDNSTTNKQQTTDNRQHPTTPTTLTTQPTPTTTSTTQPTTTNQQQRE